MNKLEVLKKLEEMASRRSDAWAGKIVQACMVDGDVDHIKLSALTGRMVEAQEFLAEIKALIAQEARHD
jgi:hypothetical protein